MKLVKFPKSLKLLNPERIGGSEVCEVSKVGEVIKVSKSSEVEYH